MSKKINGIIYTKQDLIWTMIYHYFRLVKQIGFIEDEGFIERYENLMEYMRGKLKLEEEIDILDEYVVIEQKAKD